MPACAASSARPAPPETSSACSGRSSSRATPASVHRPASRRPECRWSRRCWCRRFSRTPALRARPGTFARAFDIGSIQLPRIGRAQAIVRGDVKHRVAARARARSSEGRSLRSPTAISTARCCRLRRSEPRRTSTRTCQPSRSNALATAAPTNPVAPVTSALMRPMPGCGDDGRRRQRRRRPLERAHRDSIAPRQPHQRRDLARAPRINPPTERAKSAPGPLGSPRTTARGSVSPAVSTITRTAMNGRP